MTQADPSFTARPMAQPVRMTRPGDGVRRAIGSAFALPCASDQRGAAAERHFANLLARLDQR